MLVMVTLCDVVFFNCTDCELVVPTGTFVIETLLGVAVSAGVTPVPFRVYFTVRFVALLVRLNVPAAEPLVVGANFTVTDTLAPAANVFGAVSPVALNSVPVTDVAEMETLADPTFLIVIVAVWLEPSPTLPKPTHVGAKDSVPAAGEAAGVGAPLVAIPSVVSRQAVATTTALAADKTLIRRNCGEQKVEWYRFIAL
jgi:hypothetical protein